jgi:hypothetical protein
MAKFSIRLIIQELESAATIARLAGDIAAAEAFERSITSLEKESEDGEARFARVEFSLTGKPVADIDLGKWALLNPESIRSAGNSAVIDCGERGRITIVGGAIITSGSIGLTPMFALLVADHAKRNFGGRGTVVGEPYFLENMAVANAAMGSAIEGTGYAGNASPAIQQTARGWQAMVWEINNALPWRPNPTTRFNAGRQRQGRPVVEVA